MKTKTKKIMIRRWESLGKKWNKLSQRHINSKESKIKGYVTNDEHITGERLSFIEGYLHALEWVINDDNLLLNFEEGGTKDD